LKFTNIKEYHFKSDKVTGYLSDFSDYNNKTDLIKLHEETIVKNEIYLSNAHIKSLNSRETTTPQNPVAKRKLLLNRKEINMLQGEVSQKGLTIVPIKLYLKKGIIKIEIALCKGKKLHDKRIDQKNKDWQRQKDRLTKLR